ncbi:MAG TPA: hypothetical protein VFN31_01205 [Candidatus Saccharimonadales bacterium]|nr:hypothetical protein [Candidatus Saccharimonadales bacterium]
MSEHFSKPAWESMSLFEQMGNIGSEVGRALNAKSRNEQASMEAAFRRGLDLIDYTVSLWSKAKFHRTRELLRAREQFASAVINDEKNNIEKYFFQFALASRINRK